VVPDAGDPEVVFCADEFGPLNLQPRPGRVHSRGLCDTPAWLGG
jgi:hypothetical protein